jgi:hypothetical protein
MASSFILVNDTINRGVKIQRKRLKIAVIAFCYGPFLGAVILANQVLLPEKN